MKKNNFGKRGGLTITKKILMVLIISFIATLTYCANDPNDSNDQVNDEATLSPPSWIIGTWSDSADTLKFVFSTDNIVQTSSITTISIDFKEAYLNNEVADVSVTVTGSSYTVEVAIETAEVSITTKHSFVKNGDDLNYSLKLGGVTTGNIVLTKE